MTSRFLKILCKIFLFSSKNIRQHFFVKYVKTKLSFGPNGRKIHKIYHRVSEALFIRCLKATSIYIRTIDAVKTINEVHWMSLHVIVYTLYSHLLMVKNYILSMSIG